ncbi:MAG: 16S rRNA (uracil(1498)-N(3))-methyltransferase [Dehalococcoidia bacterium]|nr:16S rRNA (uracil(1498)-N(3))-methyltransferase [Dehalococcoidia bacterium]
MTRRYYVEPPALAGEQVILGRELAHRVATVLRLRPGDEIVLFEGSGEDARVRIDAVSDRAGSATVIARQPGPPEPRVRVSLYQSITKGERFEWLLEKGTEAGVSRFVPLQTARAVVRPEAGGAKAGRWRRIVIEAAEQCERSVVPAVAPPQRFDDAIAAAPGIVLLPYEEAGDLAPNVQAALDREIDALFALGEISIFIGPEGGYERAEVDRAEAAGAAIVTMGRRVLRSETAGLVAVTLVMQAIGELG